MTSISLIENNYFDIKPIHEGSIKTVPKYVFENCNQVTCNSYSDAFLPLVKTKAGAITKSELNKLCPKEEKFVAKGEEFDWIYGLDQLEKELLQTGKLPDSLEEAFTVENVMRWNGYFCRMATDEPGKMREKDIRWTIGGERNFNEKVICSYFEGYLSEHKGPKWFTALSNPKETCDIKTALLKRKIQYYKAHPEELEAKPSEKQKLDPNIVDEWAKEQNRNDKKIDIYAWYRKRYHYFPLAETLKADLDQSLKYVKEHKEMHPIEKAAYLWKEIVRIHISHEANKRTGKGLASVVLLSFGYLPPRIGKEETEEYLTKLQGCLKKDSDPTEFYKFVARKVADAQKEYAHLFILKEDFK